MKKPYVVAAVAVGLVLTSTFAASLAYAQVAGTGAFPSGYSHWTSAVPNGISVSMGAGGRTHTLRVFRDQNGNLVRGTESEVESGNWSGYVLANYETGKTYTSAAGTWIVPSATVPPGQSAGYSSSWVGIGGFCENSNCTQGDGTLIQLGTESDAYSSGGNYYAWYEMLPQGETLISGFVVHPGDRITASLALLPSTQSTQGGKHSSKNSPSSQQTWALTLTDATTGAQWSKDVSYQSSELSADWIQEAPASNSGVLPLANYGSTAFSTGTVNNGSNPSFTTANEVAMLDPYGQTSNPSSPGGSKNGFNTCWGNGTLTPCKAK